MTTNEAIQRVQSLYSKGVQSQNTRLSSRHIYSALLSARAVLLKQQYDKKQTITDWVCQVLPCVELIKAPLHECPCVPSGGCWILRSKFRLPRPVNGIDSPLIESVTSIDGRMIFNPSDFELMKYLNGNKFTATKPVYYFRNGFLYIVGLKMLKVVAVNGIFHDFIVAQSYASLCGDCEDCNCKDPLEMEFPIDSSLERPLFQIANEELIIMFKQMDEDKKNNSVDDVGSTGGQMIHSPQQQQG